MPASPAATPTAKPPAPGAPATPAPTPAPSAPPPRTGEVHDAGAARHDGLRVRHWTSQGAVKVLGDVEVDQADLAGLVSIRGTLKGGSVTCSGTLDVGGAVELSGTLSTDGDASLGAAARAASVASKGTLRTLGGLSASAGIRSEGILEVHGGIAGPRLEFHGRILVDEEVAVADLLGTVRGASRARSIRAERVTVRRGGRLGTHGRLTVTTIEATEVDLEDVEVEYLRADRIRLGPGAQVARLDGTVTSQHGTAHVGPVSRSPKPYGLSR